MKRSASALAAALSFVLHAGVLGTAAVLVAAASKDRPPEPVAKAPPANERSAAELELPTMVELGAAVEARSARDDDALAAHASGQEHPRPDDGDPGRGGSDDGRKATNLAEREQAISLTRATRSRLDRSQLERDRDGDRRTSPDPRRAMREPMELTFVAFGPGKLALQREHGADAPKLGTSWAAAPSVLGAPAGGPPERPGEGEAPRDPGGAVRGTHRESPAAGWLHGAAGRDARKTADVRDAKPEVPDGRDATPALEKGDAKDDKRAEQEVHDPSQSLLHASPRGGNDKDGAGGERGPKTPASGGDRGTGSTAKALGQGAGGAAENDELDRRRLDYERRIKAKINPLWANAFPKWAALEGLQGRAIIHFVVAADGTVTSAVVARPSGIPEFDENVRRAVLRASPLPPVPEKLKAPFVMFLGFDSPNPAVR